MANNSFRVKNSLNLTPQASEPSGLEIGDLWSDLDGKIYRYDGSGSKEIGAGAGSINYIANPDFESNVAGYAEYADAAGVAPVDGTGGAITPSTFARSTSSPLRGAGSGLFSKATATQQGKGVSYDFTIDTADRGKVLEISFDYTTSANYVDGGMRCYIYDVTNSRLIEPSQRDILANSGQAKYTGYFQASSDSSSYRLIWHVSSASTAIYEFKFDNVRVGPVNALSAPNQVTCIMKRASGQTSVNTNNTAVKINLNQVAQDTSGMANTGTSKIIIPESGNYSLSATISRASGNGLADYYSAWIYINGVATILGQYSVGIAGVGMYLNANVASTYLNKGDEIELYIFGRGNNSVSTYSVNQDTFLYVQKIASDSASVGSSVVAASIGMTSTQTITSGSPEKVTTALDTVIYDTSGIWDNTNKRFNIPETGLYQISAQVNVNQSGTGSRTTYIYVNGSQKHSTITAPSYSTGSMDAPLVSPPVMLNKGDFVEVYFQQDSTANRLVGGSSPSDRRAHFSIFKVNSPAIIPPTEFVGCSYNTNAGQAVVDGNTIIYEDIVYDSHNAYNPSTGVFTAPVSGYYDVEAAVHTSSVAAGAINQYIAVNIFATTNNIGARDGAETTTSRIYNAATSVTIYRNKGETIQARFDETLPAVNLSTLPARNWINITKVS